jgi:hypothetical protein
MIRDIKTILIELKGFEEIEFPYPLKRDTHIKYITIVDDEETFYRGGQYVRFGDDKIFLTNGGPEWAVPINVRDNNCNIIYTSRFFINENTDKPSKRETELEKTIIAQQRVIEKMTETIKRDKIQIQKLSQILKK